MLNIGQHFIPAIRRVRTASASRIKALENQNSDFDQILLGVHESSEDRTRLIDPTHRSQFMSEILICQENGRNVYVVIKDENAPLSLVVFPSKKYAGHAAVYDERTDYVDYLGSCEEVYKALQDNMYTEVRYAQRIREKVLNSRTSVQCSAYQIQVAQDFLVASDAAKHEWLYASNKFVFACGKLNIDLPKGYRPKDVVPRSLQYK